VACALLDHVHDEPPQTRGPAFGPGDLDLLAETASGQHLRCQRARPLHRILPPQRHALPAALGGWTPYAVRVGVSVHAVPKRQAAVAVQLDAEHVVIH
jgi:hypothetical protein